MTDDQYADHLIDVFLSGLTSISNDCGWESDSLMSLLIAFRGQIPFGTGNDQSNESMIRAIEKLRNKHAQFDQINRIVTGMLRSCDDNAKIMALLAKRYYVGLNDATGRTYKDCDRICLIGYAPTIQSIDSAESAWIAAERRFQRRIRAARKIILERIDEPMYRIVQKSRKQLYKVS